MGCTSSREALLGQLLPSYCIRAPQLSPRQVELVRASWKRLLDGTPAYRKILVTKGGDSLSSPDNTTTSPALAGSSLSLAREQSPLTPAASSTSATVEDTRTSGSQVIQPEDNPKSPLYSPIAFIFDTFYTRLFEVAPGVRPLFKQSIKVQGRALIKMIDAALSLLEDTKKLVPALERLAVRHLKYGAEPAHYSVVGEVLLYTLETCLGHGQGQGQDDDDGGWSDELKMAWLTLYSLMMVVMLPKAYPKGWPPAGSAAKKSASVAPAPLVMPPASAGGPESGGSSMIGLASPGGGDTTDKNKKIKVVDIDPPRMNDDNNASPATVAPLTGMCPATGIVGVNPHLSPAAAAAPTTINHQASSASGGGPLLPLQSEGSSLPSPAADIRITAASPGLDNSSSLESRAQDESTGGGGVVAGASGVAPASSSAAVLETSVATISVNPAAGTAALSSTILSGPSDDSTASSSSGAASNDNSQATAAPAAESGDVTPSSGAAAVAAAAAGGADPASAPAAGAEGAAEAAAEEPTPLSPSSHA